ncbi:uncharacterized protein LOC134245096 [Saccostrea cucullata]|uniref:uncharacterized protein LOC134245096 n=1 Tax=Saccostrea cuccullata TaxID=36930 RepID=UPI002ED0BAAB
MFEKFFQEKKSQRIIKKKSLLAFNDSLPEGIKLQTVDDIHVMLQFFHDLKEILYFNQNLLGNVIIVDVQWFADAFKNVITDKNHAEEDLFEFASDWDKFDETGELNDTLLSAIWKMNNNGYLEQKEDIMLYMEKLGLLAKMDNTKWYVPCMNKKQFPKNRFTSYPSSSILCYAFNVLPAGIYQRLIASCLQIPWKPASSRDGPFIYQTAAVFLFEKHNILLGMTPTEIQLQVFNTEGEVDVSTCLAVKKEIDNMLSILSRTFQADFKFQLAFKCKASGFVDGQESSVINEDEFSGSGFQCLSCPEEKMHFINTEDIIKYWKEARLDLY